MTEETRCAECHRRLAEDEDRVATEGGVFCRTCFDALRSELARLVRAQSEDVNYPMALVGGTLGGAVGALVWWGFTVVTNVGFGLVAVVIGIAVGKGVTMFSGSKRSVGLQVLSAGVAAVAFAYASYLVNRTFVQRALAAEGTPVALPLFPDPDLFYRVVAASFGLFDVVFLAIVLWQAWRIPAPVRWAR
jgi:hypothetical protein